MIFTRWTRLLGLILVWLAVSSAVSIPSLADTLPHGVASGDVTTDGVMLWTRSLALGPVEFEIATDPEFDRIYRRRSVEITDPSVPVKLRFRRLRPATDYHYRATDAAGASASGRFRTLPIYGSFRGVRFGVSGDVAGYQKPYTSIRNVAERDLDFFVNLGDTTYADNTTPMMPGAAVTLAQYRLKHSEIYTATEDGSNPMADLRAATAWFATLDDHEVVNDFAGGAPPESDDRFDDHGEFINETDRFRDAMQAFREYQPILDLQNGWTGDPRTAHKPDLYRFRLVGSDAAFIMLDARSFRDEPVFAIDSIDDLDLSLLPGLFQAVWEPGRTMLGQAQLERFKSDLMLADTLGVRWKFVMVSEPIQNLGIIASWDRFEGYALERSEILAYIHENDIRNVVFVAADIHGTVVNNLTYREGFGEPRIDTSAFEITTGAIAYAKTFGSMTAALFEVLGLDSLFGLYESLPPAGQDVLIRWLTNLQLRLTGFDTIGLRGSPIDAELLEGSYSPMHTRGWTEFEIDRTGGLLITTYGIDYQDSSPTAQPEVVSRIHVTPQ